MCSAAVTQAREPTATTRTITPASLSSNQT